RSCRRACRKRRRLVTMVMSRQRTQREHFAADQISVDGLGEATTDLLSAVRRFHDIGLSWHCTEPVTSRATGSVAAMAFHLHAMNFRLWHHEDAVRRPGVDDHEVGRRKRSIDDLNAARNATIEDLDATLLAHVDSNKSQSATLHTETPG